MPFTCPVCHAVSHHPMDEQHGYCGACHAFTGEHAIGGLDLWVILREPDSGKYVVRIQRASAGGIIMPVEAVAVADTLEDARAAMPPQVDTNLGRQADDHPAIVEVWV